MVKEAIKSLAPSHPLQSYISIAPDLQFDGGLVDTFLHGRDRSYTVEDCLKLVDSAGLVFQDWFLKSSYYPPTLTEPGNGFYRAVNQLPKEKIWSVMERIKTLNACHFFLACHQERPETNYLIDFASSRALDYVPLLRLRCTIRGDMISRPGWRVRLDPTHLAFAQNIDGERTMREIVERVALSGVLTADRPALEYTALELFEDLWRNDFVAMDLSRAR